MLFIEAAFLNWNSESVAEYGKKQQTQPQMRYMIEELSFVWTEYILLQNSLSTSFA